MLRWSDGCNRLSRRRAAGLGLLLALLFGRSATAAPAESAPAPPRLRFYLECDESLCDFSFLKQELTWVDWVRDRHDADVYVLLTTRDTGSGGTEALFYVSRPHGGGPAADTMRVFSRAEASDDDDRRLLLRTLQAVLARDLAERPEGERLTVTLAASPASAVPAAATKDPWNAWVMRASASGYLNGQQSFRTLNTYGNVSASRVVESSKLSLSGFGNYSEQRFSEPHFVGVQRGWGGTSRAVKSLGARWSAGGRAFVNSSKFSNQRLVVGAGPALEYDVYPYSESSRHQLTLSYEVTGRRVRYDEVTLYGKTAETLWSHGLTAKLATTQPWGTIGIGPDLSQYLHDGGKYRLTLSANAELRLARGFSLRLNSYAAQIHDQLSLPRGDASETAVLLQQRLLATSFQYFGSFGISYTFGSRTNNVVNPRLDEVYGGF
jgi:hypothetical protein